MKHIQINNNMIKNTFWIGVFVYLIYRIYVLVDYCFLYTDQDQTLMWYGTACFGHLRFCQPKFFGQNRNAMVESLLAVPLYWLGIPFHIALPLVTMILGMIPFAMVIFSLVRKNKYLLASACLAFLSILSLEYDVITSIPRSFLAGITLSVIGIFILFWRADFFTVLTSMLLFSVAYLWTVTSISVSALGMLMFILSVRERKPAYQRREMAYMLIGGGIGAGLGIYINILADRFYTVKHPNYCCGGNANGESIAVSVDTLLYHIKNIGKVYRDFSVVHSGYWVITIMLLVFMTCCCMVYKKRLKASMILVPAALLAGTTLMLAADKYLDCNSHPLYSVTRMLLHLPVCIVLVIWGISCFDKKKEQGRTNWGNRLSMIILMLVCTCSIWKSYELHTLRRETFTDPPESHIYIASVEELNKLNDVVVEEAEKNNITLIGYNMELPAVYAHGAYNYGKLLTYNLWAYESKCERRVPELLLDEEMATDRFLVVYGHGDEDMSIAESGGKELFDHLKE